MSKPVIFNGKKITHFECKDCGMVFGKDRETLRPNCKFCNSACMQYVLSLNGEIAKKFAKSGKFWENN